MNATEDDQSLRLFVTAVTFFMLGATVMAVANCTAGL